MGNVPAAPLCALEIAGTPMVITVKVNGHMLPCTSATLCLDAGSLPELRMSLLVVDSTVVTLDGTVVQFADETRAALVSMGWTPPADPGAGFLP
jgi:hypothetical protein